MGTIRNLQIVLNYPKDPFLNLATPKNTWNRIFFFWVGGGGPNRLGGSCVFERGAYWKEGAKSNHYGNNETISQTPGLKTGVNNDILWSEMESEFGDPGGTPPPRIPWSTPRGYFFTKLLLYMTYGGYAIFVPYVGVEANL